jgi:ketosteroid isomerase-like protein
MPLDSSPEQVVRAWHEAYRRRDVEGALAYMSEDFQRFGDSSGWVPMTKEQVGAMWKGFFNAFPDWTWEMTSLIASGDIVVCEFTETGTWTELYPILPGLTLEPTNTPFLDRDSDWFTVKDGLITEIRAYVTTNVERTYHLGETIQKYLAGNA